MTDFVDIGGVKFFIQPETWAEERNEIGDIAQNGDGLAMSGRPIESRTVTVRKWTGSTVRTQAQKDNIAIANRPRFWEGCIRWVEGWGQFFSLLTAISAAGVQLTGQANVAAGQIGSGLTVVLPGVYTLRVRRGFVPTTTMGWTMGFKRTFVAGESVAAGSHWCVVTGAVTYAVGSGNPAGVTQYVDGAAANFSAGNISAVDASGNFTVYGHKTDNTNLAVTYSDLFFLPFQLPPGWITQIWTNLINAGVSFPNLPRQRLSGQWVSVDGNVEAIGRVVGVKQKIGTLAGDSASSSDLREFDLRFMEA